MTFKVPLSSQPRYQQLIQFGIVVATLGGILSLIALYPGITGLEPKSGVGVLQILILIASMPLMILGALIFIKVGFYPNTASNLAQRIAVRLSLTGILFAAALGMADILGYGSNPPGELSTPALGIYQVIGMLLGFGIAGAGVGLFWLAGPVQTNIQVAPPPADARRTTAVSQIIHSDMLENYPIKLAARIRPVTTADAEPFLKLLKTLDTETQFMLLEPQERTLTVEEQTQRLQTLASQAQSVIFVAELDAKMIGFLSATGGNYQRNRHSAAIVIGILQPYTRQGIGTRLFEALEAWAKNKRLTRLELTVMTHNHAAIALYKKMGFREEGIKRHSLKINEQYIDELYMGKLLDGLY